MAHCLCTWFSCASFTDSLSSQEEKKRQAQKNRSLGEGTLNQQDLPGLKTEEDELSRQRKDSLPTLRKEVCHVRV